MPGVSPDALNIMLDQRVLTISGRSRSSAPEGYSLTHHEYRDGNYERALTLSEGIDRDKIEAELKEGVLRLKLPKSQPAPAKTINVKGGGMRPLPSSFKEPSRERRSSLPHQARVDLLG